MDTLTQRLVFASAQSDLCKKLDLAVEQFGWHIDFAPTSEAAIAHITAPTEPTLLLLDDTLPGISTLQLIAAARGDSARFFPVILVSNTITAEWIERQAQGVIDDIIPAQSDAANWRLRIESTLRATKSARELDQLKESSLVNTQYDSLTGAYNRESVITMLFRETDRVQRMKSTLCLILFDIDDFGHWNALFGNSACDEILRQVVQRTRRQLRSYDILGRAGKDEFVIGLPGCSGVNAVMLAERLRQEVFSQPFNTIGQNLRLTACFGLSMSRGRSPVVVLREAELALEQAKEVGPESIQFFTDEGISLNALELPGSNSEFSF